MNSPESDYKPPAVDRLQTEEPLDGKCPAEVVIHKQKEKVLISEKQNCIKRWIAAQKWTI